MWYDYILVQTIFKYLSENGFKTAKTYINKDEFYDDLMDVSRRPDILKEKKPLISRIFGFK